MDTVEALNQDINNTAAANIINNQNPISSPLINSTNNSARNFRGNMTPSELENHLLERSQQSIRIIRNLRENMTPSQINENRILRKNRTPTQKASANEYQRHYCLYMSKQLQIIENDRINAITNPIIHNNSKERKKKIYKRI